MGQTTSVSSRGRRRSFRTFRSPFPRRSTSHQSNLSAAFTLSESEQKIDQLNINLASEEELMTLPGITRPIAQNIVEYRKLIGRFKKVEDLVLVSGIGADKLDKIRPEICVSKRNCVSSRAQSMDSLKSTDSMRNGFKSSHLLKIVDVNKANVFDLQCVHGISQELAANIIHYRDKKGPFKSIDALLKVKGIDTIRLSSIRSYLTIDSEPNEETKPKLKNGFVPTIPISSSSNNVVNGSLHTPKHRKSLSAPIKISFMSNGFAKAPINDIFELLSAYSYRPIVEEDFKYERNGEKAVRIATWNLDQLCYQKAENMGFREVVCRTILENKFSIIAIQDVHDVSTLKLICDELNKPTLRRVMEWKDNSHSWNYCLSDIHHMLSQNAPGVGFIYDSMCSNISIEFLSLKELFTQETDSIKPEAAVVKFLIGDITVSLLNIYAHVTSEFDSEFISNKLNEYFKNTDDIFIALGDFTQFSKQIEELTNSLDFLNIVPFSTNTSSMSINPHYCRSICYLTNGISGTVSAPRYSDNVLLGGSAKLQYTGMSGVVRQGLTHMAIPRGWSWGGPASEHCPVWCEIYVKQVKSKQENEVLAKLPNGKCEKLMPEFRTCTNSKPLIKLDLNKSTSTETDSSSKIANGNCILKSI